MNAVPFVRKRRLVPAESDLKARVIVEVEVGVEQIDAVVSLLERKLVLDRLGEVPFEVDPGPGIIDAIARKTEGASKAAPVA